ncbi:hypothetical protein ACFE04_014946 [Oxalis oulophora]
MTSSIVVDQWKKAEEAICGSLHKLSNLLVYERQHLCEFERLRIIEYDLRKIQLMLRNVETTEGGGNDAALKKFPVDAKALTTCVDSVVVTSRLRNWRSRGCHDFTKKIINGHNALHKLIADIDHLKSSINDLRIRGEALGLNSVESRNDLRLLFPELFPTDEIEKEEDVNLEEDMDALMSRLMDGQPSRKIVSITGVQGMGKTALARKIYKNPAIQQSFDYCAWVTLPKGFEVDQLLHIIAKQLITGFENFGREWSKEELRGRIHHSLNSWRYFIVFDNVRTYKSWDALECLFPDVSNSSRILLTTRDRSISAFSSQLLPNLDFIFEKEPLSDEKSWELFTSKAIVLPGVEKLARAVVKKCNGSPHTISAVGKLLSSQRPIGENWSIVLKHVADDLPLYLQCCLSYFGFLPRDYNVPARKLIMLWIAEGLVQQIDGKTAPEDIAEKYLRELENHNMIQVTKRKPDGKIKTCQINYLLRAWCVQKAKETNFGYNHRRVDNLDRNDDSFSQIHSIHSRAHSLSSTNNDLRFFLSFDNREGPVPGREIGRFLYKGIIMKHFRRLQVLDLENVFRPKLPKEIGKMTELRYLGLRRTYLKTLPSSLGELQNLQSLDLKHTYISAIPISIWKMLHLRHLYLNNIYRGRFIASHSANSLTNLQTLWGAFLDDGYPVKDGMNGFINLRKLSLVCQLTQPQQIELAKLLPKFGCLQSLKLRSIDEFVQPSSLYIKTLSSLKNLSSLYLSGRLEDQTFMRHLPENLTEITLSVSKLTEDPMPMLEKLPKLRVLRLLSSSYIGTTMVCSAGGFPCLQILKLWKLDELEQWMVEKGAMPIVSEIEIRSCNKLRRVSEGIQHLKHCREIIFKSMHEELEASG